MSCKLCSTGIMFHHGDEIKFHVGDRIQFTFKEDGDQSNICSGTIQMFKPRNKSLQLRNVTDESHVNIQHLCCYLDDLKVLSLSPTGKRGRGQSAIKGCHLFDTTVFDSEFETKCELTDDADQIINRCSALRRLEVVLKYYSLLDITQESQLDLLSQFLGKRYHIVLDDYDHLHRVHHHQLQKIAQNLIETKKFTECQTNKCIMTARHHQIIDQNANNSASKPLLIKPASVSLGHPTMNLYKETMDSIHFYLV